MSAAASEADDFVELLWSLAPDENDIVALIQTYFDESYDETVLTIAGYAYTSARVHMLDARWKVMLDSYGLPYFRMSECAHGNGVFKSLSRDQRIEVATQAIELIKSHAIGGAAVALEDPDGCTVRFGELTPAAKNVISTPYELCVWHVLSSMLGVIRDQAVTGHISYFFEAGHMNQGEANALMNKLFKDEKLSKHYRYRFHGFEKKLASRPCQTADLLAWQVFTESKRQMTNSRPEWRKDFVSLTLEGPPHNIVYTSPDMMLHMHEMRLMQIAQIRAAISSSISPGRQS